MHVGNTSYRSGTDYTSAIGSDSGWTRRRSVISIVSKWESSLRTPVLKRMLLFVRADVRRDANEIRYYTNIGKLSYTILLSNSTDSTFVKSSLYRKHDAGIFMRYLWISRSNWTDYIKFFHRMMQTIKVKIFTLLLSSQNIRI